jgi:SAM-dependent methyltransferase
MPDDIYDYLKDSIPGNNSRQVTAEAVLKQRVAGGWRPTRVLDFGCGDGRSIDLFRRVLPEASWTGVDIEASPEVKSRRRTDGKFVTYDGYELPFPDRSFDLVYTKQVLEHVRKPELALRELARVLVPDGLIIGQTSQFEPYHSFSLWNFTVYGFKRIAEEAGLRLEELRPGIDGFTLMRRHYEGRPPEMSRYFEEESPVNQEIEAAATAARKSERIKNFRKLLVTGQFIFVMRLA